MNKKILICLFFSLAISCFSLFARTNSTISLGVSGAYNYKEKAEVGINFNVKHYNFTFDFDANVPISFTRLSFDALFGVLPYYNNILGKNQNHSIALGFAVGADFEFDFMKFKNFFAISPLARLSFSYITPFNFEIRAFADAIYTFELSQGKSKFFNFRAGGSLSYSFDITRPKEETWYVYE